MKILLVELEMIKSLVRDRIQSWIGIMNKIRQCIRDYIYNMSLFIVIFDNIKQII